MKVLAACLGLLLAPLAAGRDVQVSLYLVRMSHARATAALAEGIPDEALFKKVRDMVKAGGAKVEDVQSARMQLGYGVWLSSGAEIHYPTEYEPGGLPNSKEYDEKVRRRMSGWGKVYPFLPIWPAGWTGEFESREVGSLLRILDVGELQGNRAAFLWEFGLTRYLRRSETQVSIDLTGKRHPLGLPVFGKLGFSGKLMAAAGPNLAGSFTPVADDGSLERDSKILVFVNADILEQK